MPSVSKHDTSLIPFGVIQVQISHDLRESRNRRQKCLSASMSVALRRVVPHRDCCVVDVRAPVAIAASSSLTLLLHGKRVTEPECCGYKNETIPLSRRRCTGNSPSLSFPPCPSSVLFLSASAPTPNRTTVAVLVM